MGEVQIWVNIISEHKNIYKACYSDKTDQYSNF